MPLKTNVCSKQVAGPHQNPPSLQEACIVAYRSLHQTAKECVKAFTVAARRQATRRLQGNLAARFPRGPDHALVQTRAAEAFKIVLAIAIEFPGQLVGDPVKRDIRLDTA